LRPKQYFTYVKRILNIGGGGNQPLPMAQDHFIPLFRLKIRNSAPHFFSFFPADSRPRPREEPLFLVISSYTPKGIFWGGLASSPQQWAETHGLLSLFLPLISAIFSSFSPAPTTPIFPYFLSFSADSPHTPRPAFPFTDNTHRFHISQNQKSHRPPPSFGLPSKTHTDPTTTPPSQPPPTKETSGGRQQQRPQAPSPSSSARAARLLQPAATTRSAVRGLHSVRRSFLLCSFSRSRLC